MEESVGGGANDLSERVARTKIDTSLSIIGRNLFKSFPRRNLSQGEARSEKRSVWRLDSSFIGPSSEKIDSSRGKFGLVIENSPEILAPLEKQLSSATPLFSSPRLD